MAEPFQESRDLLAILKNRRRELALIVEPLQRKRDVVVEEMNPLEVRARELHEEIKKYTPELYDLDMQIGTLSRLLGGKSLHAKGIGGGE